MESHDNYYCTKLHSRSRQPFHQDSPFIRTAYSSGQPFHQDSLFIRTAYSSGQPFHQDSLFIRTAYSSGQPFHQDNPFIRTAYSSGHFRTHTISIHPITIEWFPCISLSVYCTYHTMNVQAVYTPQMQQHRSNGYHCKLFPMFDWHRHLLYHMFDLLEYECHPQHKGLQ